MRYASGDVNFSCRLACYSAKKCYSLPRNPQSERNGYAEWAVCPYHRRAVAAVQVVVHCRLGKDADAGREVVLCACPCRHRPLPCLAAADGNVGGNACGGIKGEVAAVPQAVCGV